MTGLDAITQAFEATWSRRATAVTTALAVRAIRLGLEVLPQLITDPSNLTLRTKMAEASVLGGLAISVSRTALCHSISYPLTMKLGIPHGLACGFVLPEVFSFNSQAEPGRFACLADEIGWESAEKLNQYLHKMMGTLGIGKLLTEYEINSEKVRGLT
jgi:alcohol dehydrogenase